MVIGETERLSLELPRVGRSTGKAEGGLMHDGDVEGRKFVTELADEDGEAFEIARDFGERDALQASKERVSDGEE